MNRRQEPPITEFQDGVLRRLPGYQEPDFRTVRLDGGGTAPLHTLQTLERKGLVRQILTDQANPLFAHGYRIAVYRWDITTAGRKAIQDQPEEPPEEPPTRIEQAERCRNFLQALPKGDEPK